MKRRTLLHDILGPGGVVETAQALKKEGLIRYFGILPSSLSTASASLKA